MHKGKEGRPLAGELCILHLCYLQLLDEVTSLPAHSRYDDYQNTQFITGANLQVTNRADSPWLCP